MRRGQSVCFSLGSIVPDGTGVSLDGAGVGTCAGAGASDGSGFGLLAHMPVEDLPLQVQSLLFIFMFMPSGQQLLLLIVFSLHAAFPLEQHKNSDVSFAFDDFPQQQYLLPVKQLLYHNCQRKNCLPTMTMLRGSCLVYLDKILLYHRSTHQEN